MTLRERVEVLQDNALRYSREYERGWKKTRDLDKLALMLCHQNYHQWLGEILNQTEEDR